MNPNSFSSMRFPEGISASRMARDEFENRRSNFVPISREELAHLRDLATAKSMYRTAPTPATSADLAKQAEELAVHEEAQAERNALAARITHEVSLAAATGSLLGSIRQLLLDAQSTVTSQACFAKFRKELQPLAETYGVKIVLVGNRSTATLTK